MNVRISRKLLESALQGLLKEEAPDTVPPEGNDFSTFKAYLQKPETQEVTIDDYKFVKVGGGWQIYSPISDEYLMSMLTPAGQKKMQDALERNIDDISFVPGDFIEPTTRGVNFIRDPNDKDVWRDNTVVSSEIVAAYKYQDPENLAVAKASAAADEGVLVGVRDTEITYLVDPGANKFYLTPTQAVPNDPLLTLDRLLSSAAFARETVAKFNMSRAEIRNVTQSDIEKIMGIIDNEDDVSLEMSAIKGGLIEQALLKSRSILGKFFDLFRPGANLEMEFEWNTYGPTFRKSYNAPKSGSGKDMTRSVATEFRASTFFQQITPPTPGSGTYVVVSGDKSPVTSGSNVTVNDDGSVGTGVKDIKIKKFPNFTVKEDSLGYAYVLWKLGGLRAQSGAPAEDAPAASITKAAAPPEPTPEPTAHKKLSEILGPLRGREVCPGAFYFDFDKDTINDSTSGDYLLQARESISDVISNAGEKDADVIITVIGSADPIGADSYNSALAGRRADNAVSALFPATRSLEASLGDKIRLYFKRQAPGESPWQGMNIAAAPKDPANEAQRKYLRFAKAYWGEITSDEATTLAKNFAITTANTAGTSLNESKAKLAEAKIRAHIRRILLDG